MTVKVMLSDGATDEYMRFGDEYEKRNDGALDVSRGGAQPYRYAAGEWTDVEGDQRRRKVRRFWPF